MNKISNINKEEISKNKFMTVTQGKERLGEYLIRKGYINNQQVQAALHRQRVTNKLIGKILVEDGFITYKQLIDALLELNPESITTEKVSRSRIPKKILEQHTIVLVAETDDVIYTASMDYEPIVKRIIAQYYPEKKIKMVPFSLEIYEDFLNNIELTGDIDDDDVEQDEVLDKLINKALLAEASDIHFIPSESSYTVMFRLLGVRQIIYEGDIEEYGAVSAQIKDRSQMDMAERRQPQDGSFQIEYSGKYIDFRSATLPTGAYETIVIRVLDPDRVQPELSKLGISQLRDWESGINRKDGLCLICGPTGSGKTTTLNASVRSMDRFGKSIYSVEDPVEYSISYVGQVSINPAVGLDFSRAVKMFMRADPDVIVLGEVRDEETARNMVKAADTGHLVLATLHTGSIEGSITRLRDLGIPSNELKFLIRSILVQTLVRIKCTTCNGTGHKIIDGVETDKTCPKCLGSKYGGRTIVSECVAFRTEDEFERIMNNEKRWWSTMLDDAFEKLKEGLTDLPELERIFGENVVLDYIEENSLEYLLKDRIQ